MAQWRLACEKSFDNVVHVGYRCIATLLRQQRSLVMHVWNKFVWKRHQLACAGVLFGMNQPSSSNLLNAPGVPHECCFQEQVEDLLQRGPGTIQSLSCLCSFASGLVLSPVRFLAFCLAVPRA